MKSIAEFLYPLIIALSLAGCSSTTTDSSSKQSVATETGTGSAAVMLSAELRRNGCEKPPEIPELGDKSTRWVVEHRPHGTSVWIEGDFTKELLRCFKKYGEPAYLNPKDSNGNLGFAYTKEQCGALVSCGIPVRSPPGLTVPTTWIIVTPTPDIDKYP